ncbi:hypothetical protein NW759_011879 [Fusarium solani]|jgi:hypothetical protein|nr:hypothetical protein NW759_011879 [Fusarium solani]
MYSLLSPAWRFFHVSAVIDQEGYGVKKPQKEFLKRLFTRQDHQHLKAHSSNDGVANRRHRGEGSSQPSAAVALCLHQDSTGASERINEVLGIGRDCVKRQAPAG